MAPAFAVLEMHLVNFRRTWRGSTFGFVVLPVLIMLGFGITVGHFIDAGGRLGPVRYLDYIVPSQVAVGAMNLGFFESAWPVHGRFRWTHIYEAMVATPLRVADLVGGELLFIVVRLVAMAVIFLGVAAVFGAVHSPGVLAVPVVCTLLGLAVAGPCHAFAASVDSDSYFPLLMRFVLVPAGLFSGVYFPISGLPEVLRWLAYLLPLWHAVDLCRAATLPGGHLSMPALLGHLAYLLLWVGVGYWLALRAYRRHLVA